MYTISIIVKKITKDTIKNDNLLKEGLNTEIKVRNKIVHIILKIEPIKYHIIPIFIYLLSTI